MNRKRKLQKDDDTFCCTFVSSDYILCDCGDTFPSESALLLHLQVDHGIEKALINDSLKQLKKQDEEILSETTLDEQVKTEYKEEEESNETFNDSSQWQEMTMENEDQLEYKDEEAESLVDESQYEIEEYPEDYEEEGGGEEAKQVVYETIVTAENRLYEEHNYDRRTEVVETEYYCDMCGKSFDEESMMERHRQKMHIDEVKVTSRGVLRVRPVVLKSPYAPKLFACSYCQKQLKTKASHDRHVLIHTGEKPFQCTYCLKSFACKAYLDIHERTHTGARPYKCKKCPKAFPSAAAIGRHNKVHTGEKPYICQHCNKAFSQTNSMKLHILTVHMKQPWPYPKKPRQPAPADGLNKIHVVTVRKPRKKVADASSLVEVAYEEDPDAYKYNDWQ